MAIVQLSCVICGKGFQAKRRDSLYCGAQCRMKGFRTAKKGRKYSEAGLSPGQRLVLQNCQLWSPKAADHIRDLISAAGVESVKDLLTVLNVFMLDTGRVHTAFNGGKR